MSPELALLSFQAISVLFSEWKENILILNFWIQCVFSDISVSNKQHLKKNLTEIDLCYNVATCRMPRAPRPDELRAVQLPSLSLGFHDFDANKVLDTLSKQ